jgi:hypothetical protein
LVLFSKNQFSIKLLQIIIQTFEIIIEAFEIIIETEEIIILNRGIYNFEGNLEFLGYKIRLKSSKKILKPPLNLPR